MQTLAINTASIPNTEPTAEQTAERRHKELVRALGEISSAIERNTWGLELVAGTIERSA